jgi:hypothetical protein
MEKIARITAADRMILRYAPVSIKPLFQYESNGGQTGSKNVNCGDVVNLFAGNIFTSVIPNFTCTIRMEKIARDHRYR